MKPEKKQSGQLKNILLPAILLAAAALLCLYGAINGGAEEVWMKAARICMECIGLD